MFELFFYSFTPAYPYLSSAIKFLILGTIGEWLGASIKNKTLRPFPVYNFLPKMIIWAILGVTVKWAFSSFSLLIPIQAEKGLIPLAAGQAGTLLFAFFVSFEINIFYAPCLMYLHRILDNIVARSWCFNGMSVAIYSIFWFWIPAHTITFMLPENLRIMFAAFLSVALGIILGFAKRKKA